MSARALKRIASREAPKATAAAPHWQAAGVVTGVLVGFADEGRTPLVTYVGQPGSAALTARATLDLHAAHVGSEVVLVFENGEPTRPIVMGVLRKQDPNALQRQPGNVEVDVDGERMIVAAREQLVLRCGRATLTLTKAGKIIIEGTYISSRATGVQRIKGGSVELN